MERFWSKVDKKGPLPARRPELGPCWIWTGYVDGQGHGRITTDGSPVRVHRLVFDLLNESIPDGLTVDHLCRRRDCVRRSHLEPVTSAVNTLRGDTISGLNARKAHCPAGHAYTPENTAFVSNGRPGVLSRRCRICQRVKVVRYRKRRARRRAGVVT